jgi:hypothetical protein
MKIVYLIPNLLEILTFISLLVFFFLNIFIGQIITKTNSLGVNFFTGYSICFIFLLFGFILFNSIKLIYFYYGYLLINFLLSIYFYKDITKIFISFIKFIKNNKLFIIIVLPLFVIIFNHKAIGWDSFTHWMPMAQKLIIPSVKLEGHGLYYPIASAIIPFVSTLFTVKLIENSYSIYNFFLLIIIFKLYFKEIENFKFKNYKKIITLFLIIYVFYNPGILNKFTFSSYADFTLGVALLILINELINFRYSSRSIITISLVSALIVNIKNVGLVLVYISIFSFIISNYIFSLEKINNLKFNLKKLSIPLFFSLLFFLIWRAHLSANELNDNIVRYNDYFERWGILKDFSHRVIFMILERKIFFFSSFSILLILIFFRKFISYKNKILLMTSLTIFITWNLFLFFMYFVWFSQEETMGAISYWRYNMIIAPIIFYSLLMFLCEINSKFFDKNEIRLKNIITVVLSILLILLPIKFIDKLRRDISYPNIPQSFFVIKNKNIDKALYIGVGDEASYQAVRASYYLSDNFKYYKPRVLEFINIEDMDFKDIKANTLDDSINLLINKKNIYDLVITNYKNDKNEWIYNKIIN